MRPLHRLLSEHIALHPLGWSSRAPIPLDTPSTAALQAIRGCLAAQLWTDRWLLPSHTPPALVLQTDAAGEWGWGAVLARPPLSPAEPLHLPPTLPDADGRLPRSATESSLSLNNNGSATAGRRRTPRAR